MKCEIIKNTIIDDFYLHLVAIEIQFFMKIILSCELTKILDCVNDGYVGYLYESYKARMYMWKRSF